MTCLSNLTAVKTTTASPTSAKAEPWEITSNERPATPTTRCPDRGRRARLPGTPVSGTQPIWNSAAQPPSVPPRHLPTRIAFTLTELLVVIAIIGILASSVLFAMWGAMEMAREARTRTQITKLNELLMTRWNSYRTRAISVDRDLESLSENVRQAIRNDPSRDAGNPPEPVARPDAFEMPDRREDVWPRNHIEQWSRYVCDHLSGGRYDPFRHADRRFA
jgi:prepilin-type N-terminal cleavage/methylation domain-containing protein